MDLFDHMQTFVRVVEAGSITAAAESLEVAKSAVSRRLADLEAHLGAQLFRRTTRRLSLTDTGQGYYERCIRILAEVEEAELSVAQAHGLVRGRLRVAMPLSFGLLHLGPAITDFMQAHPQVTFDLDFNDRQLDLLQEGFDLAIRIARLEDSTLIARPLAPIHHLVCASPGYLALHGVPAVPADLASHTCLAYSNVRDPSVWRYVGPDGDKGSVKVAAQLNASNGDFLCAAAASGQGIVMEPNFITHGYVERGELVPILTDFTWPRLEAYAVYPQTRHVSSRVRAFVDFLVERFSGVPYWDRCFAR
jgi:DNA-binding transcriptional LysR family regulator